jgi:hypothetical protein
MLKKISLIPSGPNTDIWYNAPQPASKYVPQWYKDIPQFMDNAPKLKLLVGDERNATNATIKRCVPFLDAMTTGYTYTLADDISVFSNNGVLEVLSKTGSTLISSHDISQFDGLHIPDEYHKIVFKFENPWVFNPPLGYSMMFTHPVNRLDLPFVTFTGVVDVDSYDIPVQFPFLLKKDFEGILESGTPVAQFFPVKRESWKIEAEQYDERSRLKSFRKFHSKINRSYQNQFWHKKIYN